MTILNRSYCVAALLASLSLTGLAQAQDGRALVLTPPVQLQAPGASEAPVAYQPAYTEKSMSLPEAQELLLKAEGKEWAILQIQAPSCEKNKSKQCKEFTRECRTADKFAHKYGKHATCSALYTQTKVLLIPASLAPKQ